MKHPPLTIVLSLLISFSGLAQVAPTTLEELNTSIEARTNHYENSIFTNYPIRNVGPVVMSGRITDLAVHPDNPRVFYVGFASAGIFKTTNSGNTMTPVFDHAGGAIGIGDLAISESNPEIIWAGTGENNSSRSSYAGTGIYKSMDGGESWEFKGLGHSQHIGRIITHPTNENVAWVASLGALYTNNDERGVFKTTDGGDSWTRTLFINDSTGVIDLMAQPGNPEVLLATAWERDRKAWNFKEGGEGSGLYKSTDGGDTWTEITDGLPSGSHVGRMGIDFSQSSPNVVYMVIDNQEETTTEVETSSDRISQATFLEISNSDFQSLDDRQLNQYLRRSGFPSEYDAARVKQDVADGKYESRALSDYVGDANQALFDTEIIGLEVYRSNDAGDSWTKVNSYDLDNVFFTYGYYFGEVRVDPNDSETLYTFGVPFLKSTDGGKTWEPKAENQSVHVDHHALWINPDDSEHLLLGNDGGLYESHDGGENFIHHNVAPVGQFYTVAVDMEEPYNIYGGLQDNGTFYGPSTSTPNRERPWQRLYGGDGMHVAPKPGNANVVYVGFQYGNYFRRDLEARSINRISPRHDVGVPRYRYNWNSPVNISHHNPDIIYFGSQKLVRSMDEGRTWTEISPDLTNDLPNGDVPYSTLTTIAESPLSFNTIWVGTDDGNIQLTRDGGATWIRVSDYLPQNRWVSEVHASVHDEATAYVSLNGYRYDEFETYIYKTTDYGQTWTSIKGNLPEDVVNVIIQDPVHEQILYAGLDHGSYVSFDDGNEWHYLSSKPNVASYDMVVHPRELDLVIGTHGRSIYVMDIEPIHEVAPRLDENITGISIENIRSSSRWGSQQVQYRDRIMPNVDLMYFLNTDDDEREVRIKVMNTDGDEVVELSTRGSNGFNVFSWNLVVEEDDDDITFLEEGMYTIEFSTGRSSHTVEFEVE